MKELRKEGARVKQNSAWILLVVNRHGRGVHDVLNESGDVCERNGEHLQFTEQKGAHRDSFRGYAQKELVVDCECDLSGE